MYGSIWEHKSLAIFLEEVGGFQYKQKFFSNCTPLSSPSRSAFPDWVEILVVLQQKRLAHQVVNNRIIALFHGPVDRLYKRSANKEGFLTMRSASSLLSTQGLLTNAEIVVTLCIEYFH